MAFFCAVAAAAEFIVSIFKILFLFLCSSFTHAKSLLAVACSCNQNQMAIFCCALVLTQGGSVYAVMLFLFKLTAWDGWYILKNISRAPSHMCFCIKLCSMSFSCCQLPQMFWDFGCFSAVVSDLFFSGGYFLLFYSRIYL